MSQRLQISTIRLARSFKEDERPSLVYVCIKSRIWSRAGAEGLAIDEGACTLVSRVLGTAVLQRYNIVTSLLAALN